MAIVPGNAACSLPPIGCEESMQRLGLPIAVPSTRTGGSGPEQVKGPPSHPRRDFGAEIREWSDFALSRRFHAIRRDTGIPRPVMMLMTLQATLASVFWVGRVRAWRPRPITFLCRDIATSAKERFP